jgi:hypothetical protein
MLVPVVEFLLLTAVEKNEMGGACSVGVERREACIGVWWGNLRERDPWGDPGIDGRIIIGWIFRKWEMGVWAGLGWLRIETGDGQL